MVCCCVKKNMIHKVHTLPPMVCVLPTDMHEQVETLYYTIIQVLSNSGVHLCDSHVCLTTVHVPWCKMGPSGYLFTVDKRQI